MPIRVLIVDDSALIRQLLTELLSGDDEIIVVGVAPDPFIARERIKELNPDVLTLDIEMPRMDGLSFLERLMALRPMPVVIVSSLTQKGAAAAVQALEMGAVETFAKPLIDIRSGLSELRDELVAKVKIAARAKIRAKSRVHDEQAPRIFDHRLSSEGRIIAIGASTGGVETLLALLPQFPPDAPSILITQHMPPGFTASFSKRLDDRCAIRVAEAVDGERMVAGHAYMAPGNRHLELTRSGAKFHCRVHDGPPVSGHRPSVDVLFRSVAAAAGRNATGIILTGMGKDGAAGLLEMRQAGARTIAQDEATSIIYGMPRAAVSIGAVDLELPLPAIAAEIFK